MRKPAPTTRDDEARALCCLTFTRAAELCVEHGASLEMVIDQLLSFTLAQTTATYGRAAVLGILELAVEKVEAGTFDHLEGRGRVNVN